MFKLVIHPENPVIIKDALFEKSNLPSEHVEGSGTVETIGKIRLFKDNLAIHEEIRRVSLNFVPLQRTHLLCILTVPNEIESTNIGADYVGALAYTRIIRSFRSNYSLILSFNSQSTADKFYSEFNGKQFNPQEFCYVLHLSGIIFTNDAFKDPNMIELPTCVICLERLDTNISGLTTFLSSTREHNRWKLLKTECQICITLATNDSSTDRDIECSECGDKEGLWVCSICGYIACGRYREGHSKLHSYLTGHNFTVDMENGRVWDYAGDAYAHRVTQGAPFCPEIGISQETKDVNNVIWEYEYLINTQLEAQREMMEFEINQKLDKKNSEIYEKIKGAKAENEKLRRFLSKQMAKGRKKKELVDKLRELREDNEFQENLTQMTLDERDSDEPVFESNRDKKNYMVLMRLRRELEEIMKKL